MTSQRDRDNVEVCKAVAAKHSGHAARRVHLREKPEIAGVIVDRITVCNEAHYLVRDASGDYHNHGLEAWEDDAQTTAGSMGSAPGKG